MDPFVLCSKLPSPGPGTRILDIGCGCGVMAAVLGFQYPEARITGIEIQKSLADLALKNVIHNNLEQNISILNEDIKNIDIQSVGGRFDLIISNPPYKKKQTGRLNPNQSKAIARHEVAMNIQDLVKQAATLLKNDGKFMVIFPFERLAELKRVALSYKIFPDWLRFVHTSDSAPPKRVIFCGQNKQPGPGRILAPVFVKGHNDFPF